MAFQRVRKIWFSASLWSAYFIRKMFFFLKLFYTSFFLSSENNPNFGFSWRRYFSRTDFFSPWQKKTPCDWKLVLKRQFFFISNEKTVVLGPVFSRGVFFFVKVKKNQYDWNIDAKKIRNSDYIRATEKKGCKKVY